MEPRVNYVLVGLFVLLLGAALFAVVLWFTVGGIGAYATYVAFFEESVAGLNPQSSVRYLGVDVGQVRAITLEPTADGRRVRLLLNIREDVRVTVDTVATLRSQGLVTGLVYVELSGGTSRSPPLRPRAGEAYPEIQTRPSAIGRLEEMLPALAEDFAAIAANLRAVSGGLEGVFTEENRAAVANTLRSLEEASRSLASSMQRVQAPLGQAEAALEEVRQAASSIRRLSANANRKLDTLGEGSLANLDRLVAGLQRLVQTMQQLARDVERDPNILLFGWGERAPGPGEAR